MKKWLVSLAAALLLSSIAQSSQVRGASEPSEYRLEIDYESVSLDVNPIVYENNEIFVPIYMVRGWGGIKLQWDQESRSVTARTEQGDFVIASGRGEVIHGGKKLKYIRAPYIHQGRMMVPASLVETMTGAQSRLARGKGAVIVDSLGSRPLASAEGKGDVRLYAAGADQERIYQGLVLEAGNQRKRFDWETPVSWKEAPQLYAEDVTGDSEPEAIVLLNQGSGTGIHIQEAHVIRLSDFKEIPIQPFEEIISEQVQTSLRYDQGMLHIRVVVEGSEPVELTLPDPDKYFGQVESVGFGAVIHHQVKDHKLSVSLGGAISMAQFVGELMINYVYRDGRFEAESLQFTPYEQHN